MVKSLNRSLWRHIRIHATPFVHPSCDFGFKLILRDSHVTAVIAEYISSGSFCENDELTCVIYIELNKNKLPYANTIRAVHDLFKVSRITISSDPFRGFVFVFWPLI